ncbi:MAG: hypothetical protein ABIQ31_11625 [Ferruginibacter sp.]
MRIKIDPDRMYFGGVNGFNLFFPEQVTIRNKTYNACLLFYGENKVPRESLPEVYKFDGGNYSVNPMEDYTKINVRLFDYQDPVNNKYKYRVNTAELSNEQSTRESIIIPRSDLHLFGKNTTKSSGNKGQAF